MCFSWSAPNCRNSEPRIHLHRAACVTLVRRWTEPLGPPLLVRLACQGRPSVAGTSATAYGLGPNQTGPTKVDAENPWARPQLPPGEVELSLTAVTLRIWRVLFAHPTLAVGGLWLVVVPAVIGFLLSVLLDAAGLQGPSFGVAVGLLLLFGVLGTVVLGLGYVRLLLNLVDKQPARIGDLLSETSSLGPALALWALGLLVSVAWLELMFMIPVETEDGAMRGAWWFAFGCVLQVLSAVQQVLWGLALFALIDRRLCPLQALTGAWALLRGRWASAIGIAVAQFIFAVVVGLMAALPTCGLSAILVHPWVYLSGAVIYRALSPR